MARPTSLLPAALLFAATSIASPPARAEEPMDPHAKKAPQRENRLAKERSPYLRQHATNPVDWRPWGTEAFDEAKRLDRPVFLSIGYAACHWCHVMAHESFEDDAVARVLNEVFVCVKVDREERPDVDDVYMAAVQLSTGRGGWPMSVFLLPDGRPFLARTYLPPSNLSTVSRQVERLWKGERRKLEDAAEELASHVRAHAKGPDLPPTSLSDADLVKASVDAVARDFDRVRGGFDRAPKFPPHAALLLLLDRGGAAGGTDGLAMARKTLDAMAAGGVRDHVGGGFHRYATDAEWLVPHFEKMLYDNALLALAYAEAYALERRADDAEVVRETLGFVERELAVRGGGYASSLDADTEGEEGKTYVWTLDDLVAALGAEDGRFLARAYGATAAGNWRDEATGRATGTNILHLPGPLDAFAASERVPAGAARERLARLRARLLAVRAKRAQPGRDDKVITGWNGLLVSAFARAGTALSEPRWLDAARALARFLLDRCRDGGRLLRFPKDSGPRIPAFLDDAAHLADGLLDLAAATGEPSWTSAAASIADEIVARFEDPAGGFHSSADDHETLLARPKEAFDSPIPSANATAARVLLRLSVAARDPRRRDACDRTLSAFRPLVARAPTATLALARVLADRAALGATGAAPARGDVEARRDPVSASVFLERGEARPGSRVGVLVRVAVDAGFHVNPSVVSEPGLVATSLSLAEKAPVRLVDVAYPPDERRPPAPGRAALPSLAGTFEIRAAFEVPADAPLGPRKVGLVLVVQACDAASCRLAESIRLDVPLRFADADGPPRHPASFR